MGQAESSVPPESTETKEEENVENLVAPQPQEAAANPPLRSIRPSESVRTVLREESRTGLQTTRLDRSMPPLTTDDMLALTSSVNGALVDVSASSRKYAMQALVKIVAQHDLTSLERRSDVLEPLCLALSLNVLSTDATSQACALAGLRTLSSLKFCVSALAKAEVENSVVSLLQRTTATDEALRAAMRVLRNLVELDKASDLTMFCSDEQTIKLLDLGQRLGGACVEHALVIVRSAPNDKMTCQSEVWAACKYYLLNISHSIPQLVDFAGFVAVRREESLREIVSNQDLFDVLIRHPEQNAAFMAVMASGLHISSSRDDLPKMNAICKLALRRMQDAPVKSQIARGIRALIEQESLDWATCFEAHGALDVFARLLSSDQSGDQEEVNENEEDIVATALIIVMRNPSPPKELLGVREAFFNSPLDLLSPAAQLAKRIGRALLVDDDKKDGLDDDCHITEDQQLISLALGASDDLLNTAGALLLARRLEQRGGWIDAGLFRPVGTPRDRVPARTERTHAFSREEEEYETEKQFIWDWDSAIIDTLIAMCSPDQDKSRCRLGRVHAIQALINLAKVEGADRLDGLQIQASWEGLAQRVPINTARPELFKAVLPSGVPEMLSSPKELRSGLFKREKDVIAFQRRPTQAINGGQELDDGTEWTVTVWLKQVGTVLSGTEPMRRRTILGVQTDGPVPDQQRLAGCILGIDEQFMLGFQPPAALAMFRQFGQWEQLSSGWHHITLTCSEQKKDKAAGLDLLLGRTKVITCYVDGNRLGVPALCSNVECPSITAGILLGNDWEGSSHLGGEFALGEVRVFSRCLTERVIASGVARSSFNRRPNWNLSSLGESRFTSAHIWARLQLAKSGTLVNNVVEMLKMTPGGDDAVTARRLAATLCMLLATVPPGKNALIEHGAAPALEQGAREGDRDAAEALQMLRLMMKDTTDNDVF